MATCRYNPDAADPCTDEAEYLVLGANQALGEDGIAACGWHLTDVVDSVEAPAQVWPA